MMYYGHGMGAGWGLIVFAVVLLALLVAGGLIVGPIRRNPAGSAAPDLVPDAERVLADRLARGEMDTEDYEQRLRTLRAARR